MITLLATLGLSILVMLLAVLGMAAGVLAGREPIRGSCGGVNGAGCDGCERRCSTKAG